MVLKLFRIALLFIIFSSCGNEKKTEELPLVFKNDKIIKKSGKGCVDDSFSCSTISLEIPIAEGGKISTKINKTIKEHLVNLISTEEDPEIASPEELAKAFISEQQKSAEKFGETVPWKASVTGKIQFEAEDLISIAFNSEIFTGGAHGYRSLTFLNFDPETGELYSQKGLFHQGFWVYAEKLFREKQNIPDDENINSTGFWFKNDIFELPANIGFDKENVILVYNAYEISSFADGDILLEIPKKEVLQYLKIGKNE